jgi:hypothetical protein
MRSKDDAPEEGNTNGAFSGSYLFRDPSADATLVPLGTMPSHCCLIVVELCTLAVAVSASASAQTWDAKLAAQLTGGEIYQGVSYPSSTSLRVAWTAPSEARVDHYAIRAEEKWSSVRARAESDANELVITGLKSATAYAIQIRACLDVLCDVFLDAAEPAAASTPAEYWRVVGSGGGYATAARLVPDGNIGSYAFRYGPWAGPEKDGAIQLYYTPLQRQEKGMKIGQQTRRSMADPVEAALSFEGVSGFGLLRGCGELPVGPGAPEPPAECVNPQGLATGVSLFQAVPLASTSGEGPRIRLFFEAPGRGGRQRIVDLDSQDGYEGRDFHRGEPTRCETAADYEPGGGCEPALAIGVDIDGPDGGNPNLRNARQFKIAWPTAVSTAWDLSPGTFMWFTTEWRDGRCSRFDFNAAYAVWNGKTWDVQYGADGCPKILAGVQAPAPVHIGGSAGLARYKLYFSRHARPGGPGDPRIAIKPLQLLYADPERTGDAARTDFEDWEPLDAAREVHFLWPDGSKLTEDEESRLDDFVVFAPGGDPARLIMYSDMSFTGLNAVPFIGTAVLVNP